MIGEERAILYWLALETGLRAGELRSLERVSFDLGNRDISQVKSDYARRDLNPQPMVPKTIALSS